LIDASDELRAAQERALGGGDSDQLRSAASAEREALRKLTDRAQELLGRDAPAATLERVASTLRAAAVAPETRELLTSGRLSEELQSAGFGAFEGMSVPAQPRPRPSPRKKAPARPSAAERRGQERLAKLRERLTKLRQEATDAEREAKKARVAADRANARFERAAAAAAKTQSELEAAEEAAP
jgi:broad specificity phosphatase PhoE